MTRDQAQQFIPLLNRTATTGPYEAGMLLQLHQALANIANGQVVMQPLASPAKLRAVETEDGNAS